MKKRILASLLSLCLIVGLLPTAVLAADESGTEGESPAVCTCTALCTEGNVDETCPVCAEDYNSCAYEEAPTEPAEEPTEEPAGEPNPCALTEGCTLENGHEGACVLADEPQEPVGPTMKEQLAELIAALPDPADIDPLDEEQVAAVNGQISEIYAFAEENGLNVENDETINAVIAALYPVELLAASIPADGGELASGEYELTQDITLTTNLTIPTDTDVTIDLNGHTLTGSGNGSVITVYGELTLNDSTATKQTDLSNATEGTEKNGDGSWTVTYAVYDKNNELSYRSYTAGAITGGKNGTTQGGGITVLGGTVVMNGGIITGNETGNNQQYALGGGIHLNKNEETAATFTMTDGAVSGNTANSTVTNGQGSGGGIFVAPGCKFEMTGGVFCFNQALGTKANGGAAFIQGEFSAANAVFSGNTSAHWTGGIMGPCTLTSCILVNNKTGGVAGSYGGAVSGGGKIDSCVISHNTATGEGGGLYLTVATTIDNSVIQNNTSGANGGGISISSASANKGKTISISQSSITENKIRTEAEDNIGGGGIYVGANNTLKLTGAEVSENTVSGKNVLGGGIYNAGKLLEITGNTEITNNAADGTTTSKGGGIFGGNTITIESGEISGNRATQGGGVYIGTNFSMNGGKIINNTAADCGGGIYANAAKPEFSGSAIVKDNTSGDEGSVVDNLTFVSTNSIYRAYLSGQLTDDAEIGIRVTANWINSDNAILVDAADNYTITSGDLSHIVYDGDQYVPYLDTDSNTVKVASAAIITFNSNTGTTSETTVQKVQKGTEAVLADNTFVRDGYIFSGWSTTQNGSGGTSYADGATITTSENMTLYAQWIELKHEGITLEYGSTSSSFPAIEGVALTGWTSADTSIVQIADGQLKAVGVGKTTITADASLTRSGEKLTVDVTVTPMPITFGKEDGENPQGTITYQYTGMAPEFSQFATFYPAKVDGGTVSVVEGSEAVTLTEGTDIVFEYDAGGGKNDYHYLPIDVTENQTYGIEVIVKLVNPNYRFVTESNQTLSETIKENVVVKSGNLKEVSFEGVPAAGETMTYPYNGQPQPPVSNLTRMSAGSIKNFTIHFHPWGDTEFNEAHLENQTVNQLTPEAIRKIAPTEPGSYLMIVDGVSDSEYTYRSWIFTITKATVTIRPNDKSAYVGDAVPVLGKNDYTVTGLVGNDTLTTVPTLSYASTPDMNTTGTYAIKASGAAANEAHYELIYEDGTLTVSRRSSGGGGGGSSSGNTTTETEKNPDGSTTTTVTDKKTGTVTETTKFKDGSTLVVETKKDGTVTTTETAKNGVKVRTVEEPGEDVTAKVTIPKSVGEAVVTIPADVDYGMVAVDADTGEVVKLSVPTRDGMTVKLDGSADLVLVDRSRDFTDTRGHWAEDAIDFATAHELFSGTSDTTFTPDSPMTRAMLMTVLARFDGQDTTGGAVWYEKAMAWARENGISDGSNPDGSITREQLATMLWRYAGSPAGDGSAIGRFTDSGKVSSYAVEAMNWAVGTGLFGGMGDGTLAPQGSATRAQVATILMRFVENLTK